jgi:dienelactone hydrolase
MRILIFVLLSTGAWAQVPARDSRITDLPSTDTHYQMPMYRTLGEWEARRAHLKRQILSAAGLSPMPVKHELHPQIFGRIENQDYSIEKVLLETQPGYYLGGNLYRPLKSPPPGGFPAVLSPHGHWVYGRLEHTPLATIPGRCINLARQGYVVFAYDMVGYNDTIQTPHAFGDKPVEQLWGFGPLGLQLWNSMRVVDFLQSLPGVDREKIGATGASGGGTQTFLLTAVDDRVKFSAPVNMISAIMQGGSPCENAPNLRVGAFNVEIGAMMAPRPMLMVSASGDWTRNTPREEYLAIRGIYELYDRAANVETVQIDAPHNYNQQSREAVYQFFGKHVLGDGNAAHFKEKRVRLEKLEDMLALHNRTLPEGALTFEGLRAQWMRVSKEQVDAITDRRELRELLTYALTAEWPARVASQADGEKIVLSRAGRGDRVPGIWIQGKGTPALLVDPAGAEAARNSPEAQELLRAGRAVLLIDAFQTGSAVANRDQSASHFLTFNKTDDANRVQDILTALAFLNVPNVRLTGKGKAAVWCLFAAAVAEQTVDLQVDLAGFAGTDEDFTRSFFVPGIQRAGGLRAAKRAIGIP